MCPSVLPRLIAGKHTTEVEALERNDVTCELNIAEINVLPEITPFHLPIVERESSYRRRQAVETPCVKGIATDLRAGVTLCAPREREIRRLKWSIRSPGVPVVMLVVAPAWLCKAILGQEGKNDDADTKKSRFIRWSVLILSTRGLCFVLLFLPARETACVAKPHRPGQARRA